jgi:hypothetical protein
MNPTESKEESVFARLDNFWPVPENLHPTQAEVMSAWKDVSDFLSEMMDEEELPREQAFCSLIVTTPNGKVIRLKVGQELAGEWEGIGFVFGVLVKGQGLKVKTRGFGKSERTEQILAQALTTIALEIQRAGKRKAN